MKKVLVFSMVLSFFSLQAQKIETVIQKGHDAALTSLASDKENIFLVTGSRDNTAKLWNIATGKEIRTYSGHEESITSVDISFNKKFVATASNDGTAKVWETSSGKEVFSTKPSKRFLYAVLFSLDGRHLVTAGYQDSVKVWNIESGKRIATFPAEHKINLRISPDGQWLAIGESNKKLSLINTASWEVHLKQTMSEGYCGPCNVHVAFRPDSKTFIKASKYAAIQEFDVGSGALLRTFGEEIKDNLIGLAFLGDTIVLAKETELFIYGQDKLLTSMALPDQSKISDVQVVQKSLYVASEDNRAYCFSLPELKKVMVYEGALNKVDKGNIKYDINNYWDSHIAKYIRLKNELLLTRDGRSIMKGKTGVVAKFWDIATGVAVKEYTGHESAVLCFAKSKDEKIVITGDASGRAKVWDSEGNNLLDLYGHREPIFSIKLSPDEKYVSISSWDAIISTWNLKTGERVSLIDLKRNAAYSLSYTTDGLYLIAGRLGKSLEMWEPDSKTLVKTFIGHTDVVSSIDFHPTRKNIMLTSSWDGSIRAWDIHTGLMVKKFITGSPVQACLFSMDGRSIITAGNDRLVKIWDFDTGRLESSLEGHLTEITNLTLSEDGKMLVSVGMDGIIKFWNFEKRKEFYEHLTLGKGDWMVRTREGYFNGTFGAMDYIHFVRGNEVIKTDQVFEKFYKPNLLPEIFKKQGSTGQIKSIEEIYKSSPPPSFKMNSVLTSERTEVDLYIKVTDLGGGVSEVKLTQNGKRIALDKYKVPNKKGESAVIKQRVSLVRGMNLFEVSGFSKERLESSPVAEEILSDFGDVNTTCHILAIGIDKYENPSLTLKYARNDAEAFTTLISEGGKDLYKDIVIYPLYDSAANKENILNTLDLISLQVKKNDVFILYYAGHGSMHDDNFYFIPSDCSRLHDGQKLAKEAIHADVLQEKLKGIQALKQIIIMDACYSGGSAEVLATRGSVEEKAIAQLSRSAGIHILASAGGEQAAKEVAELNHGLFTYLILQGLKGEADGSPKDGKVTVYELKSYLDDRTPELNLKYGGKPQYPYTFSRGHDFPVLIIGK